MILYFNASMPRSGSELFQVLLHQHPEIYGSPTSPLLEFQYGARSNFELPEVQSQPASLMTAAFASMCHDMAVGYYKPITDREYVIDKNRGWSFYYTWVQMWQENPKIVCLVRDLRDILCSMEKVFQANRHRPVGPDNPANMQGLTFEGRCQVWLNSQPVGLALQRVRDSVQNEFPILYLRYEDLVEQPQKTLDMWYSFVGLDSFQHQFDNVVKTVEEKPNFYGPYGNHEVRPKVEAPETNWRDMMSRGFADDIKANYVWYFDLFKY